MHRRHAGGGALSDVAVVGLGAMGAAVAWQCAARGLRVTGYDAGRPPHNEGSTHGGSRVIRETAFEHPRYVPLVRRAYALWEDLGRRASQRLLVPTGALYAGAPRASVVTGSRRSALEHGVPCEELTADGIRARWPVFNPTDGMVGLLEHRGGVLRPEACVRAMLDAAREAGAELHFGRAVDPDSLAADHVVLATGPWMLDRLHATGVQGAWVERVIQHWFVPQDPAGLGPASLPLYLWEDADGLIFYGFPMLDGALKCAVHHRGDNTAAETVDRQVSREEIELARRLLAKFVPPAAGAHLGSRVCLYTNTPDGDFIIDRVPSTNRIMVSACSGIGFKFAPAIGEIVADLIEQKPARFELSPFSLSRFGGPSGPA